MHNQDYPQHPTFTLLITDCDSSSQASPPYGDLYVAEEAALSPGYLSPSYRPSKSKFLKSRAAKALARDKVIDWRERMESMKTFGVVYIKVGLLLTVILLVFWLGSFLKG